MSDEPGVLAIAVASVVLLAVVARAARAAWASVMQDDHVGLMTRMFARQGVEVPAASAQGAEAGGRAVLRCAMCAQTARCRQFLAADGDDGIEAFCPNAGFIRALKHGRFRS